MHYKSQDLFKLFFIICIYIATAKFGLSFDAVNKFATLVWFPSGLAVAALLLDGYRFWPAIFFGAFIVNFITGASAATALGVATGNTLEALCATYVLKRIHFSLALGQLKDVLALVFVAIISAIVAATIGSFSLFAANAIPPGGFFITWRAWWVGDAMGILLVAPFLLLWAKEPFPKLLSNKNIELIAVFGLFLALALAIFREFMGFGVGAVITYPYLIFPPLIWIALRFGQKTTVTAVFFLTILAIWTTTQGYGPFASGRLNERLLLLEGFLAVSAITAMILAAVVTERKEFEKRKDEFISMASHELKTPVTSLKIYAQLLSRSPRHQSRTFLAHMNQQIDKLTNLINDLLNVSQMQSGKFVYHKDWFDFDDLLMEIIEPMQITEKKHQIILKGGVHRKIYGDKDRIGEIIINLLTNAIKYSPKSERIIVSAKIQKNEVVVSVRDLGIGIEKKHYNKIFESFYQIGADGQYSLPGLGMGLYIASEIVKNHGGRMWVESKKGKGSTFTFTLPIGN